MKKRIDSLRRIAALQQQIRDLKKWRQAQLESERDALNETQTEVIAAMQRELASFGPLAVAATRRLQALDRDIAATAQACKAHERETLDHARRASMIEQAVDAADARLREANERKELIDIMESWQASRASSHG